MCFVLVKMLTDKEGGSGEWTKSGSIDEVLEYD